jgi:uncharacterized glyoxalase superfamily protein PhnB
MTLRTHRVLPHPPESAFFKAFARPELLARWWGPKAARGNVCMMLELRSTCEHADATAATLTRNGVALVTPVHETPWGTRECTIRDAQGHTLYFGQRQ